MKLNSKSINFSVDTVEELTSLDGVNGDICILTDEDRGGTFIYDDTAVDNQGTVFGYWRRQYDGAVNVKWFGAVDITGIAEEDWVDSTTAIQNALSIENNTVYFPVGTYLVSHIYLSGINGLKLVGVPGRSVIKKPTGTYNVNVDGAISGIIDFVSCDDITIDGLKFDGNKANALPAEGTHLNGVNFYDGCNRMKTVNCEFVDIEFQGLNHQVSYEGWISGCKFITCGWSGIGFAGGYLSTFGSSKCLIENCVFVSIWAGIQSQIAMTHLSIKDNHFVNSSIILAQDVNFVTISGNTFDGAAPSGALGEAGQDAITIESDSNVSITNNVINAAARHGIYVVGNYIENGPNEGILTCDNITIVGNTITNCTGSGIQFSPGSAFTYDFGTHTGSAAIEANYTYATNGVIEGNIIANNSVRGIVVGIANGTKIVGNIISENDFDGINLGSSKNTNISNNIIRNNSQSATNAGDGIQISSSPSTITNVIIDSNNIYDDQGTRTQRYGIYNPNANATVKALNNILKGNGTNLSSTNETLPYFIEEAPAFLNGALPFGSGFETPGYYIDNDGIVHLRGLVLLGASGVGNPIFTLPVGYRPAYTEMFVVLANSVIGRCDVLNNGNVVATGGVNSQYFNLSGISFAASR